MSPQELNKVVAESDGWQVGHCEASGTWILLNPAGEELCYASNATDIETYFLEKIPGYTSDLNAIMPLIAKLPDHALFTVQLVTVVKGTAKFGNVSMAEITKIQHTADAAQRTEAYCLTRNLIKL